MAHSLLGSLERREVLECDLAPPVLNVRTSGSGSTVPLNPVRLHERRHADSTSSAV